MALKYDVSRASVTRRVPRLVSFSEGNPSSSRWRMAPSGLRAVCLVVLLVCVVSPTRAQLIPIKTIPIAQGDQFQIFPANNVGMGSASIALADSLADPFANPAMGTRLTGSRFFGSPALYSVSRNARGGRPVRLAVLVR